MMNRIHVPAAMCREISVAASADPRSIARVLRGECVRGMADSRIRRALAERGITPPIPADEHGGGMAISYVNSPVA